MQLFAGVTGVLENFTKFKRQHLCQGPLLINLYAGGLKERDTGTGVFQILQNFEEHFFHRRVLGDYF